MADSMNLVNKKQTFVPFRSLQVGQYFQDLDGNHMLRIGNTAKPAGRLLPLPLGIRTGPMDWSEVNAVAVQPFTHDGRRYPTGQVISFCDDTCVVIDLA